MQWMLYSQEMESNFSIYPACHVLLLCRLLLADERFPASHVAESSLRYCRCCFKCTCPSCGAGVACFFAVFWSRGVRSAVSCGGGVASPVSSSSSSPLCFSEAGASSWVLYARLFRNAGVAVTLEDDTGALLSMKTAWAAWASFCTQAGGATSLQTSGTTDDRVRTPPRISRGCLGVPKLPCSKISPPS